MGQDETIKNAFVSMAYVTGVGQCETYAEWGMTLVGPSQFTPQSKNSKLTFCTTSGWRLRATGQVCPISTSFSRLSGESGQNFMRMSTLISAIRRGAEAIIFSTSASILSIFISRALAAIPIVVRIQVARDVAVESVGEKDSPLPWLSTGASVTISVPEARCVAWQRSSPVYITLAKITFLRIFDWVQNYKISRFVIWLYSLLSITMKRILAYALFGLAFPLGGFAQQQTQNVYDKEHNYGLMLHTRGLGLAFEFSNFTKGDNYRLVDLGIYSIRHPKEAKMPNDLLADSRPYVFGKQYAPIIIHGAIGRRHVMAEKLTSQSVRINFNYALGPAMAILKPVYYEVKIPNPEPKSANSKYQRFNATDQQMQENTMGPAPFTKGLRESGFMPGGFAKTSFSFEWGGFDYKFYSLETGVLFNAFPANLPIFAYPVNDRVFVNLFLALSYGSRK